MNSMTGFGSASRKLGAVEIEVHVKSVNGRFLETRFHLPKEFSGFESDLKSKLKGFSRGSVDVYVHRRVSGGTGDRRPKVSLKTAEYWLSTMRLMDRRFHLKSTITVQDILGLPNVIEYMDRAEVLPGEKAAVLRTLSRAAASCVRARLSEGQRLEKELRGLLDALEKSWRKMGEWRKQALAQTESRLKSRIAEMNSTDLAPERIAIEAALIIDRMDVQEELVRLNEHIRCCRKLLRGSKSAGKKLDFYCQELLREVNTIGSKAQLAPLTQVVVEAKSIIEKFREQVQNVE